MLSALAVAAVLGVAAAAAVDSIRSDRPAEAARPTAPPACGEGQLSLDLLATEDPPLVVLRHARGPRCTVPPYDVLVRVVPRVGSPGDGLVLPFEGGLSAPGVQSERTFRYHPRCRERGPFEALARVGPYSDRALIIPFPCLRSAKEVAAFHRECVRSWNAANPANSPFVVEGGFDIAVLFRSSNTTEVDRCGLHLVSSQTARWMLAYRVAERWWSIERQGQGDPPSVSDFYDTQQVEVRPNGTIALRNG
jgi:hypothetical protein